MAFREDPAGFKGRARGGILERADQPSPLGPPSFETGGTKVPVPVKVNSGQQPLTLSMLSDDGCRQLSTSALPAWNVGFTALPRAKRDAGALPIPHRGERHWTAPFSTWPAPSFPTTNQVGGVRGDRQTTHRPERPHGSGPAPASPPGRYSHPAPCPWRQLEAPPSPGKEGEGGFLDPGAGQRARPHSRLLSPP